MNLFKYIGNVQYVLVYSVQKSAKVFDVECWIRKADLESPRPEAGDKKSSLSWSPNGEKVVSGVLEIGYLAHVERCCRRRTRIANYVSLAGSRRAHLEGFHRRFVFVWLLVVSLMAYCRTIGRCWRWAERTEMRATSSSSWTVRRSRSSHKGKIYFW